MPPDYVTEKQLDQRCAGCQAVEKAKEETTREMIKRIVQEAIAAAVKDSVPPEIVAAIQSAARRETLAWSLFTAMLVALLGTIPWMIYH